MPKPLLLPVTAISGIGDTKAKAFKRLGISTLKDLIYHIPRAYEKRGDVKMLKEGLDGETHAFILTVATLPKSVTVKGRISITKFRAFDGSGTVEIVFFNQNYVKDIFSIGAEFRFWGKITQSKNKYQIISPEYESVLPNCVLPEYISVYHLTSGLSNKLISKAVREALSICEGSLVEFLPDEIRKKNNLPTLAHSLHSIHAPQDDQMLKNALRRMAYDELFCFALALHMANNKHNDVSGAKCPDTDISNFTSLLPYTLTNAQKNAINEIAQDMKCSDSSSPMSRILIGDVGSGKTVCAAAAAYISTKNGYQCAFLAPTEVLASQHFHDLQPMFEKLGISCALLTGSTPQKDKKEIYNRISSPKEQPLDVVIGTHALLNDKVSFRNLGLIIADEQHRFGANQRSLLKERNQASHMLVMSATPIPRSLALTVYGDLSVSLIDEMPRGRSRVDTFVVDESYRERINAFCRKLVSDGGQVYIVCPAIESEEENNENAIPIEEIVSKSKAEHKPKLKTIVDYTENLKNNIFPDLRVEFLHGKMKPQQKDAIMKAFSTHKIDILVSTTVIEVGINVPNACLMVIENAERFGLSQLHQLRGRVGRGKKKSYCILVSDSQGSTAKERLNTMKNLYNGYEIAEKDLLLRGPGDFFSSNSGAAIRQSGGLSLKFSSLYSDIELLQSAFSDAKGILAIDPTLSSAENHALLDTIEEIFVLNENTLN